MTKITKPQIEALLADVIDPYLGQSLLASNAIKNIDITAEQVTLEVQLAFPAKGYQQQLTAQLSKALSPLVDNVKVTLNWQIAARTSQSGLKNLANVKNIIAVASAKGGVGKSTTAVNLALALAAEGSRAAILDADIYGPSQPQMLGAKDKPESKDGKSLEPVICHDIQSMSIGYLIDQEDTPMIWRGPMVTSALQQLLTDTNWQQVDYLVVDLPPGTGDIQLTLSQKIPVNGAVIVTTPQDIALLDARKGLKMFERVKIPVLGIVENMSLHTCSACGHQEPIFGAGGGKQMAAQYDVTLLGQLPLATQIREQADSGTPTVVAEPNGAIAQIYRDMARQLAAKLALQAKDYSQVFPKIVVEN